VSIREIRGIIIMDYQSLTGEYRHKMDAQGRLAVPSRFRDSFRRGIVASRGIDQCIDIYSESNWAVVEKALTSTPKFGQKYRRTKRLIMSGAFTLETDKQGRVLLPSSLREHADLDEDVTVVGVGDHLEVWSSQNWSIEMQSVIADRQDLAESIDDNIRER